MPKSNKKTLNGAQVLLKSFQDLGIDLMIGYTGGAIMDTFDQLPNYPSIRFMTARHEQGAGFIAQGYTRASGKLAPVLVTSGPGATNTITAVADAQMDSIPLFVVTGQVARKVVGTDAFQESDVLGMMYPITKYSLMPLSADEVASSVAKLAHIATTGRPGAVCMDFPKDVQTETTSKIDMPKKLDLPGYNIELEAEDESLNEAIKLIENAKRPVILGGHGLILSDCRKEILDFLEKTQIPIALTVHGLSSVPASHPLNLGMMGMHGEIEANRAIQKADLVLAFGMRFDDRVTGRLEDFAKNAKIIHIEIDPSEIHKNKQADVPILGDLKLSLQRLLKKLKPINPEVRSDYFAEIETNKNLSKTHYKPIFNKGVGPSGELLMSRIIHDLSQFTNGQDNIVADVGQHQMFAAKFYKYERFNTWFNSGGLGTMGFCLPASIGVKLARPKEEVWAINGDGGVQMNIQELGTIDQENLNINIIILNNNYLGMVRQWQDLFFKQNRVEVELKNPDFSKLAQAYGISYRKVEKVEDILPALKWSKQQAKATIVEFICDRDEKVWPMIPSNFSYEEMMINEQDAKKKIGEY